MPVLHKNAVILAGDPAATAELRDSLERAGYRVVFSSTEGEQAPEIVQRLPWLLQPGVDLLYYDPLIGGLADSLERFGLATRPTN